MLITFAPTGVTVDTTVATPQAGPITGPYTPETTTYNYGSSFVSPTTGEGGSTPVEGSHLGGSRLFPVSGGGGAYITFYGGEGRTLVVERFKMDDATAVTAGMGAIATALIAGTAAITLNSDGTV